MDAYSKGLEYIKSCSILFAERFAPYFLCSIGAHALNLANRRKKFFFEFRKLPDLRLHIIWVAPSGFSKSLLLKAFAFGDTSLLGNSAIPITFEGYTTEPGWVGTIKMGKEGEILESPGLAKVFATGIVAIEEFYAIAKAMQQEHSAGLESAILASLDGGEVRKRLAAGPISYHTDVTLWAGIQHVRFDLSAGLGRRLFFLLWNPTSSEISSIKVGRRRARDLEPDWRRLEQFRTALAQIINKLNFKLKKIEFSPAFDDLIINSKFFEDPLYERLALGYHVVRNNFDSTLNVEVDSELRSLINTAISWRRELFADAQLSLMLSTLEDAGPLGLSMPELVRKLQIFGIVEREAHDLIERALRWKRVTFKKGKLQLS